MGVAAEKRLIQRIGICELRHPEMNATIVGPGEPQKPASLEPNGTSKPVIMNRSTFHVETRWGGCEESPSPDRLRELIAELTVRDEEHPDAWMIHEDSGWSLRLDEDRFAYLDNPDCETIARLTDVSAETVLALWTAFATGGPDAVAGFEWQQGARPISEQESAERSERARQALLMLDREFFDRLGPEASSATCRTPGCVRGHIQYSVLCKAHHFEQIRGRPCPFLE